MKQIKFFAACFLLRCLLFCAGAAEQPEYIFDFFVLLGVIAGSAALTGRNTGQAFVVARKGIHIVEFKLFGNGGQGKICKFQIAVDLVEYCLIDQFFYGEFFRRKRIFFQSFGKLIIELGGTHIEPFGTALHLDRCPGKENCIADLFENFRLIAPLPPAFQYKAFHAQPQNPFHDFPVVVGYGHGVAGIFAVAEVEAFYAPQVEIAIQDQCRFSRSLGRLKFERVKFVVFIRIDHIMPRARRQQKHVTGLQHKFAVVGLHKKVTAFADFQLAIGVILKLAPAAFAGAPPRSAPIQQFYIHSNFYENGKFFMIFAIEYSIK